METCNTIELIKLEERFLKFIAETHIELTLLEHLEKCITCRQNISKNIVENKGSEDFGNLFKKTVDDDKIPKYKDSEDIEIFINARIQWRSEHLEQIQKNAELELQNLREKIKN
jgi:hypothetical protein